MRFAVLISLFSLQAFAVGGVVNKGGDSVRCQASAMGPAGYYTVDFALAIGRGATQQDFVAVRSWSEAELRLLSILRAVDRDLARSFEDFAIGVDQREDDFERRQVEGWKRKWISHRGHPFEVDDIGDVSDLPMACKFGYKPGPQHAKFKIYRMIQRSTYEARRLIIYRYDKMMLKALRTPLQMSFLMVHEWLWDITEDLEVNRRVNAFLHSKRIHGMSTVEIMTELYRLGL